MIDINWNKVFAISYLLESTPRHLLNFSRLKCGAYLRAALI